MKDRDENKIDYWGCLGVLGITLFVLFCIFSFGHWAELQDPYSNASRFNRIEQKIDKIQENILKENK